MHGVKLNNPLKKKIHHIDFVNHVVLCLNDKLHKEDNKEDNKELYRYILCYMDILKCSTDTVFLSKIKNIDDLSNVINMAYIVYSFVLKGDFVDLADIDIQGFYTYEEFVKSVHKSIANDELLHLLPSSYKDCFEMLSEMMISSLKDPFNVNIEKLIKIKNKLENFSNVSAGDIYKELKDMKNE